MRVAVKTMESEEEKKAFKNEVTCLEQSSSLKGRVHEKHVSCKTGYRHG